MGICISLQEAAAHLHPGTYSINYSVRLVMIYKNPLLSDPSRLFGSKVYHTDTLIIAPKYTAITLVEMGNNKYDIQCFKQVKDDTPVKIGYIKQVPCFNTRIDYFALPQEHSSTTDIFTREKVKKETTGTITQINPIGSNGYIVKDDAGLIYMMSLV